MRMRDIRELPAIYRLDGGPEISDTQHHGELVKGGKQDTWKACQASRRYASSKPRVVLGEVPNERSTYETSSPTHKLSMQSMFHSTLQHRLVLE